MDRRWSKSEELVEERLLTISKNDLASGEQENVNIVYVGKRTRET